jgi:hypothetical protein
MELWCNGNMGEEYIAKLVISVICSIVYQTVHLLRNPTTLTYSWWPKGLNKLWSKSFWCRMLIQQLTTWRACTYVLWVTAMTVGWLFLSFFNNPSRQSGPLIPGTLFFRLGPYSTVIALPVEPFINVPRPQSNNSPWRGICPSHPRTLPNCHVVMITMISLIGSSIHT